MHLHNNQHIQSIFLAVQCQTLVISIQLPGIQMTIATIFDALFVILNVVQSLSYGLINWCNFQLKFMHVMGPIVVRSVIAIAMD